MYRRGCNFVSPCLEYEKYREGISDCDKPTMFGLKHLSSGLDFEAEFIELVGGKTFISQSSRYSDLNMPKADIEWTFPLSMNYQIGGEDDISHTRTIMLICWMKPSTDWVVSLRMHHRHLLTLFCPIGD